MEGRCTPIRLKPVTQLKRFLLQGSVLACRVDGLMPAGVGTIKSSRIKRLLRSDTGLVRRLDRIAVGLGMAPRGEARTRRLEPGHHLEHFDKGGKAELHDLRALARTVLHHTPGLEMSQRLTHGCPRGFEAAGERLFIKPCAGAQPPRYDVSLQRACELIGEACRTLGQDRGTLRFGSAAFTCLGRMFACAA